MDIQRKKGLLDVCVLAVLRRGPSYGYKIIGEVSSCIPRCRNPRCIPS